MVDEKARRITIGEEEIFEAREVNDDRQNSTVTHRNTFFIFVL